MEAVARARGPRRGARRRPRPRHPAVRRGGADDAADRGRAAADRRRVAQQPARVHRPRPGHAQGAGHGLDAAWRPRRRPSLRRPRRDPPRAGRTSTSRWTAVGLVVDWADWDRLHRAAGLLPEKSEHPLGYESVLHDRPTTAGGSQVGYVTSFLYSPVLQRHVGLARVRPDHAAAGHRGAPGDRPEPRQHDRARAHREAPPVQPREEDGQAMSGTSTATVRRDRRRRWPQRSGQRRLPRQGRAAHPGPRAAPPRRRRGDHRGAGARVLLHHVLLRAQPAAAGDHPRARPGRARVPAADDAVLVPPDRRRRLPAARRRPRPERPGDPPPLASRRRRLRPLPPRPRPGLPGGPAAVRQPAARRLRQGPRGPGRREVAARPPRRASTGR